MKPSEVVHLLRSDPGTLLRQVSLKMFGGRTALSSVHEFLVIDAGKTMRGFTSGMSGHLGRKKSRPVFHIKLARSALPGDRAAAAPDARFFAEYIAMGQVSDGLAATHRMLPAEGGPDVMVTTQLTGCTFGIGSDVNGNRLVSHIQPPEAFKDPAGRKRLVSHAVTAGFEGGELHSTFNRDNGYQYEAVVVGLRRNGQWQIFAQHVDAINGIPELARTTRLL